MAQYHLLGISGSLRAAATNTKLVKEAARLFEPTEFSLADINLPLYDGDLEDRDGVPTAVQTLADQISASDAVVISTPEYNKNLPGGLKNALDWVSRTKDAPWAGKPVAIMSAAAGRAGGERAQNSLRLCMQPFRPRILQGPEVMIANSGKAFGENGQLSDDFAVNLLTDLMNALRAEIAR